MSEQTKVNDGGHAFPQPSEYTTCVPDGEGGYISGEIVVPMGGMSRRDYFAAKAMQALLADPRWDFLYATKGHDQPVAWNGYVLGRDGDRRMTGQEVLGKLACEAADATIKALESE